MVSFSGSYAETSAAGTVICTLTIHFLGDSIGRYAVRKLYYSRQLVHTLRVKKQPVMLPTSAANVSRDSCEPCFADCRCSSSVGRYKVAHAIMSPKEMQR